MPEPKDLELTEYVAYLIYIDECLINKVKPLRWLTLEEHSKNLYRSLAEGDYKAWIGAEKYWKNERARYAKTDN